MFELPPEPTPLSILLAEKYPAAEIPAEKYPDKRAKKKRKRNGTKHLTEDELARLFSVIQSVRDRALFQLAYRAGLRASEIGLLQMRDYDAKADKMSASEFDITDPRVKPCSSKTSAGPPLNQRRPFPPVVHPR